MLVLGVIAVWVWHSLNGPPFQMVVEPNGDYATVQFRQVGAGLASNRFRVDGHFEKREVVILDSPAVTIPGGRIEFADTTLMPGRFTIRIGRTVFDVMPRSIEVDGKQFEWFHGDFPLGSDGHDAPTPAGLSGR
jgi:hypothetical protein